MQGNQVRESIKKYQKPDLRLFENLVTFRELVDQSLKGHYADVTVYKWVRRGLPHHKIRGKLFFSPKDVALWLQRTS